jgi:aromatic ring-cleaving dioxygenase
MLEHSASSEHAAVQDPGRITAYHAHVYYDPATSRPGAALLRDRIGELFPDARLGRWHDQPVGPHPQAMYQIVFRPDQFGLIVPWLLLNRRGLTILVHPETGDDHKDHAEHALWLGAILPLRLDVLTSRI